MLRLDPPIQTERLLLRAIDPVGDVDAIHAYASREDVCRYIPWTPKSRDDVVAWLPKREHTMVAEPGGAASLAVVVRDTGALIGDTMLMWDSAEHRTGELGYVIHPDHAGRGFATEVVTAMLDLAFGRLDLRRMIARLDERNVASARVLERSGLRREARLVESEWFKGEWITQLEYAVLAREWPARRAGERGDPAR